MELPITITKEEVSREFGEMSVGEYDNDNEINDLCRDACRDVWRYVCKHSSINWEQRFINGKLTEYQLKVLKEASLEQARIYIKLHGRILDILPYNEATGQFVQRQDIIDNEIHISAYSILSRSQFIYTGF